MSNEVSKPGDSGEINLNEVESSGRPFLKNGVYSIRCISCEKQTSKKQNPMLVFKWEICAPETITVTKDDGTEQSRKIAGLQLTDWIVLGDTGWSKLKALHKVAGRSWPTCP